MIGIKKKLCFLITSIFLLSGFSCVQTSNCFKLSRFLYDEKGSPSETLVGLLQSLNISQVSSWDSIIEKTAPWIVTDQDRKAGNFLNLHPNLNLEQFYNNLSLLYMTQTIPAYRSDYDCAVVLGSIVSVMRQRLWFLVQEWNRGVRFKKIVFLSGSRVPYDKFEDKENFVNKDEIVFPIKEDWEFSGKLPKNENEIAKFLWAQMKLPNEWKDLSVDFIEAESLDPQKRSGRRDTIRAWMGREELPKRVLFVSSQPFIGNDQIKIATEVKDKCDFDIAGPGFSEKVLENSWGPRVCLDNLAAWIKEVHSSKKSKRFF